jgi:hypothetical protein
MGFVGPPSCPKRPTDDRAQRRLFAVSLAEVPGPPGALNSWTYSLSFSSRLAVLDWIWCLPVMSVARAYER